MVVLFEFSESPPYCFPRWVCQFTIPPTVHKGSLFSTSSPILVTSCLFDNSHSDRYEVISFTNITFHASLKCASTERALPVTGIAELTVGHHSQCEDRIPVLDGTHDSLSLKWPITTYGS